jgi:hypothetical protein
MRGDGEVGCAPGLIPAIDEGSTQGPLSVKHCLREAARAYLCSGVK